MLLGARNGHPSPLGPAGAFPGRLKSVLKPFRRPWSVRIECSSLLEPAWLRSLRRLELLLRPSWLRSAVGFAGALEMATRDCSASLACSKPPLEPARLRGGARNRLLPWSARMGRSSALGFARALGMDTESRVCEASLERAASLRRLARPA